MAKKSVGDLSKADLEGKVVFVRADLNVSVESCECLGKKIPMFFNCDKCCIVTLSFSIPVATAYQSLKCVTVIQCRSPLMVT